MNPTILGVIGPGFLNQVPTLHNNETRVGGGLHDNTGIASSIGEEYS